MLYIPRKQWNVLMLFDQSSIWINHISVFLSLLMLFIWCRPLYNDYSVIYILVNNTTESLFERLSTEAKVTDDYLLKQISFMDLYSFINICRKHIQQSYVSNLFLYDYLSRNYQRPLYPMNYMLGLFLLVTFGLCL
jgi:hypothetical protein